MGEPETNFRLSSMSQGEQNATLKEVASALNCMATQMVVLAQKVDAVADSGEKTAERLEDSLEAIKSFAESQIEVRKTLAECVRRLDALEGKKAS